MKEMIDIIKGLYIFYFSKNQNKEKINELMVNLEEITDNWLTDDERKECIEKSNR